MEPIKERSPKTCSFFASGTCRDGNECKFTHIKVPVRKPTLPNHFYYPPEGTERIVFTNSEGARVFHEYSLPEDTVVIYHSAIQIPQQFDNPRIIWMTVENPRHMFAGIVMQATRLHMYLPNTVVFYFSAGTDKYLESPGTTLELACQLTQQGRVCHLLPHVHMGRYFEALSPHIQPLESSFTDALYYLRQLLPQQEYTYAELVLTIGKLVGHRCHHWTPALLAETLSHELKLTPEFSVVSADPPLKQLDDFLRRLHSKQVPLSIVQQALPDCEVVSFMNLPAIRELLGVSHQVYWEIPMLCRHRKSRVDQDRSEPWSTRNSHLFTAQLQEKGRKKQPAGAVVPVKKGKEK